MRDPVVRLRGRYYVFVRDLGLERITHEILYGKSRQSSGLHEIAIVLDTSTVTTEFSGEMISHTVVLCSSGTIAIVPFARWGRFDAIAHPNSLARGQ